MSRNLSHLAGLGVGFPLSRRQSAAELAVLQPFRGARLTRATQGVALFPAAGTDTIMPWDLVDYDTDGFANLALSASKLTNVTGSLLRVRAFGGFALDSGSTGAGYLTFRKNGAAFLGIVQTAVPTGSIADAFASSSFLMQPGDYIEASLSYPSGAARIYGATFAYSSFSLEVVPG